MRGRRHPKRLPHVHHGKANTRALLTKPGVELRHAGFRPVLAAKPDRPTPLEIADHNPIGMTLADRNLVDPDRPRTRRARACQLRLHVLHLQRLDGVPIKRQFLRNIRDRCLSATAADKIGKALGVERVVCQKVEPFLLHLAAATAIEAPYLQLKQGTVNRKSSKTQHRKPTMPKRSNAAIASRRMRRWPTAVTPRSLSPRPSALAGLPHRSHFPGMPAHSVPTEAA